MISPLRNNLPSVVSPSLSVTARSSAFSLDLAGVSEQRGFPGGTQAAAKDAASSSKKDDTTTTDSNVKLKAALAAFRKEASMTPAQRARRDVLEKMKLTEDDIKAMPPEQRKATEKAIADEVDRRLRLNEAGKNRNGMSGVGVAVSDPMTPAT